MNSYKQVWMFFFAVVLFSCNTLDRTDRPEIEVTNIWSRPAFADNPEMDRMSTPGVIYFTLHNNSRVGDRLTSVDTEVAETTEVHRSEMENGRMSMKMIREGVEIPANEQVEFKPGGLHIMLFGMKRTLNEGDRFNVTLHFEKSGDIEVQSEVLQP